MTKTIQNDEILEFVKSISPDLLPYFVTGAEALQIWPKKGANGSQGQKGKRRGRPRKQAENGPADGSQTEWSPPEKPVGSDDGGPKREEIAIYFIRKYIIPPIVFSGSQIFRFNDELGWIPCTLDDVKNFIAQFLIQEFYDRVGDGMINYLVTWSKAIWNVPPKQRGAYFLEMKWETLIPELKVSDGFGWIPCRNALINTQTGETREFSQALFTVGRVPCDFDPAADCPRWKQFLAETLDPESVLVLQEFFGVSLTYDRSFQGFALLYGEGGNGKGVVCEILKTLNAGAVCAVSLAGLGEKFSRYPLTVCRVNIHPDTNSRINRNQIPEMEEFLKAGAMGEAVHVEKKGGGR